MPDFFDVAMFQAAVQKNKNVLPKPNKKSDSKSQSTKKDAMASEVTLVNDGSTSQSQHKDTKEKTEIFTLILPSTTITITDTAAATAASSSPPSRLPNEVTIHMGWLALVVPTLLSCVLTRVFRFWDGRRTKPAAGAAAIAAFRPVLAVAIAPAVAPAPAPPPPPPPAAAVSLAALLVTLASLAPALLRLVPAVEAAAAAIAAAAAPAPGSAPSPPQPPVPASPAPDSAPASLATCASPAGALNKRSEEAASVRCVRRVSKIPVLAVRRRPIKR